MARKTIEQRIALNGGKEIIGQLRGLGTAGQKAFDDIRKAAEKATGPSGAFARSLSTLRARFRELREAAGRVGSEFGRFGSSLNGLGSALGSTVGRIVAFTAAVGAAVGAVARFVSGGTAAIDEAGKTAQSLGLTIEAYQGLQFAARQSGVAQNTFEQALTRINDSLIEARDSARAFVRTGNTLSRPQTIFDRLGVRITDANGQLRSTESILGDIADRFRALPDGPEKAALAIDLFGQRAGPQLIPFLNEGSAGIQALVDQARRLGLVFTQEDFAIAQALQDAQGRLAVSTRALRNRVSLIFAPLQTRAADDLTEFLVANSDAVLEFAEGLLTKVQPIIKDLFSLLAGRPQDVETAWILEYRKNILAFGESVQSTLTAIIIPAFNALISAAGSVAVALNGVFGTELTGAQLLIAASILKLVGGFKLVGAALLVVVNGVRLAVAVVGLIGPAIKVAAAAWPVLIAGAKLAFAAIAALATPFGLVAAAAVAAGFLIVTFWDQIKAGGIAVLEAIGSVAIAIGSSVAAAAVSIGQSALELLSNLSAGISDRLSAAASALSAGWRTAMDAIRAAGASLFDFLGRQVERLRSLFASLADSFNRLRGAETSGSGARRFATGGRVRGPGTGTSDSIPAWLSDGEFVIRSKAVKKYGAGFFAALNSMRLPNIPGFATGGMVSGASDLFRNMNAALSFDAPRFADGGMVTAPASGRPVTINFGGEAFQMVAQDDVIERLGRAATRRRVTSLGRKPGWYE
jgi:hypothetical protein